MNFVYDSFFFILGRELFIFVLLVFGEDFFLVGGGIGGVISYIWCHVGGLVVAFVTHTPVHQHVIVTDHFPPVQFTRLAAGRHTFTVNLVLGTHDLLLTALLATGERAVSTCTENKSTCTEYCIKFHIRTERNKNTFTSKAKP